MTSSLSKAEEPIQVLIYAESCPRTCAGPDCLLPVRAEYLVDSTRGTLASRIARICDFCFDAFRQVTNTGAWLAAHHSKASAHSFANIFNFCSNRCRLEGREIWHNDEPLSKLTLVNTLAEAREMAEQVFVPDGPYIDIHAWMFTPSSFELLVLELAELGEIDWKIDWIEPQPKVEFLICLSKGRQKFRSAEEVQSKRVMLMKQMLFEIRAMIDRMAS